MGKSYTRVKLHPETELLEKVGAEAYKRKMSVTKFTEKAWKSYLKTLNERPNRKSNN